MPFEKHNRLWEKANHKGHAPTFIRPHTIEERKKLSNTWKKIGHPKGMKGKSHSIETKIKMSLARQGNKNANWKNGITELIRGIRRSPKYYQWRKKVFQRNGSVCKFCKKTRKLEAHHIKPIYYYPDKIFDVKNGIVLCQKCHIKIRGKNE